MAKTRIDDDQYKPAGADTELQYNAAGSIAASPLLSYDYTNNLLITDNIRAVPGDNFNLGDFDAGSWIHINIAGDISLNNQSSNTWNFAADGSLLFPNITTTQRNAIVAVEGMQVYNVTTHQFEMYNGTIWTAMGGGGSGSPSAPDLSVQFNTSGAFDGNAQVSIVPGTATNKTLLVGVDPTIDVDPGNPGFTWANLASTFGQSMLVASNIEIYDSNRVSDIGSGTAQLGLNVRAPGGGSYSTTITAQSSTVYAPNGMTEVLSPYDILLKPNDPFGKTVLIDGTSASQPTPDHSAILEVSAINRGFLPPRLTTLQRDNIQIFSTGYALINDYTLLAGATVTVDGTALIEGVDWTAAVDNNTTAASLATAVDALASVTAFQSDFSTNPPVPAAGPYVIIYAAVSGPAGDAITLATSDPVNISLSGPNLTGGLSVANGLEIYNTDTLQPEFWNGTTWVAMTGSSTPAGADTQVQYNNAGAFGASPAFAWIDANQDLRLGDPANTTSDTTIDMAGNGFGAVINMDHTTGNLIFQANDGSNIVLGGAQVNIGGSGNILLRMDGSAHFGVGLGGLDTDTAGNITSTVSAHFGSGNALPASAVLEADSTTRGFLPPRMSTTQRDAIATPATGLEIYNLTTNQPEVYNGTIWTSMGGGGGSPAAPTTSVQFNNGGAFGGSSDFIWDGTNIGLTNSNGITYLAGAAISLTASLTGVLASIGLAGFGGLQQQLSVSDDGILHIVNNSGAGLFVSQEISGSVAIGTGAPVASAQLDMQAIDKGFLEPRLTTTQRDAIATPATGLQIYNTDTNELQFWNGTVWGPVGSGSSSVVYADDVFTYSGSNIFTITTTAIANSDVISQNGLVLRPTTDYTLSGTTLTILTSLTAGDQIQAKYATSIAGSNVTGFVVDEFTNTTGPTPVFTLSSTPIANGEFISLNGILLRPTTDYTLSGVTLTIITATTNGDFIQAQYATGTGGGGGGTPGGADTQVQYNAAGTFGGSANLTLDVTNSYLRLSHPSSNAQFWVQSDVIPDILLASADGLTIFGELFATPVKTVAAVYPASAYFQISTDVLGTEKIWKFDSDGDFTTSRSVFVKGALAVNYATVTTTYTAANETIILADATAGAFTITLPPANINGGGRLYTIKKIDATVNPVTVDGDASETIDGSLTYVINTQWDSVEIVSNSSNWFII